MKTNPEPRAILTCVVSKRVARSSTATLGVAMAPNGQFLMPSEASIMT